MSKKIEIEIFSVKEQMPPVLYVAALLAEADEWITACYQLGQWNDESGERINDDDVTYWFVYPSAQTTD